MPASFLVHQVPRTSLQTGGIAECLRTFPSAFERPSLPVVRWLLTYSNSCVNFLPITHHGMLCHYYGSSNNTSHNLRINSCILLQLPFLNISQVYCMYTEQCMILIMTDTCMIIWYDAVTMPCVSDVKCGVLTNNYTGCVISTCGTSTITRMSGSASRQLRVVE